MAECFELSELGKVVRIEPLEYLRYNSSIDSDNNWVKSKVVIKAGAFSGEYIAEFRTFDFAQFRNEFNNLYENLSGQVYFYDLDEYLEMKIQGDGIGHFTVDVSACDKPGPGQCCLTFSMIFDQTSIKPLVRNLDAIMKAFPVIGDLK